MERTPSTAVVREAPPEPAALPAEPEPEEAGALLLPQAARLAVRASARIRVKNFFIFQYFLLFEICRRAADIRFDPGAPLPKDKCKDSTAAGKCQ